VTYTPPTPEEFVKTFSDFVNSLGNDSNYQKVIELMSYQHPSLQQQMTRVCLMWLEHLSNLEEFQYDLRNEASVELAKKLLAGVDTYELQVPLI
jgi:pantoate kinase